jgi:DMSO reductase family type II enzyme chaperone
MSAGLPPTIDLETAVAAAVARAAVYRILSTAFAYPTGPRLSDIAGAVASDAVQALPAPLAAAARALGAAATGADPEAIGREYVFLFDRAVRCPPYEGAYGTGPLLAGKGAILADIGGFYAAFGLTPEGAQPETEDHVTAELEFMSVLALKEAWALVDGPADALTVTRSAQAAFLTDHLGRWAGAFAEAVAAATTLPYYTAAAALLTAWIGEEVARLGARPAPSGGSSPEGAEAAGPFTCPMAGDTTE